MSAQGSASYEEVFMFSHRQPAAVSPFVTLTTVSGAKISASPGHYLWIYSSSKTKTGPMQPARAQDIKIGDCLATLNTADQPAERSCVISKTMTMQKGLYNPHTASGSIVVDGIGALTFTDTLPPSPAVHRLVTAPGQLAYWLLKVAGGSGLADAVNNVLLSLYFSCQDLAWVAVVSGK